jgi:hypothetical protein
VFDALAQHEKKNSRRIALNIEKNRNTQAIKSLENKTRWLTNFRFFLPDYGKSKLLNPRCARYAWVLNAKNYGKYKFSTYSNQSFCMQCMYNKHTSDIIFIISNYT